MVGTRLLGWKGELSGEEEITTHIMAGLAIGHTGHMPSGLTMNLPAMVSVLMRAAVGLSITARYK